MNRYGKAIKRFCQYKYTCSYLPVADDCSEYTA